VWDWLGACRRRWWILLICLALTFVTAYAAARLNTSVYWTQQSVVFLAPADPVRPNALESTSESLIATAGVVERSVNQGRPESLTSSSSVSMLDVGDYDGWSVRLPNAGGQWASNFDQPLLEVQAAGSTPESVSNHLSDALIRIRSALAEFQRTAGVAPVNDIRLELSPSDANVIRVSGYRSRSALGIAALGVLLTISLFVVLEARSMRNGRMREREPANREYIDA